MCNKYCYDFAMASWKVICPDNTPMAILEVGSRNVNGSPRDVIHQVGGSYLGIDIEAGHGVDRIIDVEMLDDALGEEFDVVISMEMLEHVADWRMALYQMACVLKMGGYLMLTTCSPGFEYHPYPLDKWRFTVEHMQAIFTSPMVLVGEVGKSPDTRNGVYAGVGLLAQRVPGSLGSWYKHLSGITVGTP